MTNKTKKIPNVIGPIYKKEVVKIEHSAKNERSYTKHYLQLHALVYIDKIINPYGGVINVYRPAYYHVDRDEFTILTGCGSDMAYTDVPASRVYACYVRNIEHHESGRNGEDEVVYAPKFSHVLSQHNCEVISDASGQKKPVDIFALISELYGGCDE